MDSSPADVVEAGYNAMADRYLNLVGNTVGDRRGSFLRELDVRLEADSRVVDLGCGAGVPSTRFLTERHDVVGVDLSAAQIERARASAPRARFVREDVTRVVFDAGTIDAVTALYSLIHVPRGRHGEMFRNVFGWLRPGGWFLLTLSATGLSDGIQDDFLGVPMFFSSYGPAQNRKLLHDAGFVIVVDELVTMQEPDTVSSFQWLMAQRPAA